MSGNEDDVVAQDTPRRNLFGEAETTVVGIYATEASDTHFRREKVRREKEQQRC